ncbi:HK97-gp10 family putative phage morphogenesis protein [Streptomyces sp. DH8]|uniref:HK97-gp10 family putative phage morphogenesis protein n=2 Tax=Streptomyces sp. DH8 TaxID=2857008 RepID=UPI001E2F5A7F|nr:HK97-gp10 family putative phage morphogenesis protein [Streptomyces sp. DH8]
MAAWVTRIEGLDRLRDQLEALVPELEEAAKRATKDSAEAVRDDTRRTVRVDTGNLRDKVDIHYSDEGRTAEVGWKDRHDWYASINEHGTRRIPANPALGPALEAERTRFEERLRTEVRKVLRG